MSIISILNTHGVVLFIVAVFIYEFFILEKKEVAMHALFSVVATLIVTIILKELYVVPRPYIQMGIEPGAGMTTFSSFPSAHTSLAFALATAVTLHQKRFGVLLFAISSIIGLGRVVADVHYPVDIAFGILIGVVVATFFDTIHFSKLRNSKKRR